MSRRVLRDVLNDVDDDWILLNYGRWPNPTRQDKKGALAISPSIFILTEIAGVTIHGSEFMQKVKLCGFCDTNHDFGNVNE